ncbi:Uncharacterized conserved protein [Desulfacinum infernum DSM 9756]|uniref:Uncharacterized conserved protein n=1 Tax=Desulfacinum infernum DSM 9756 TaxID=1121391 RepID=A0A1M5G794_9BACT|nr:transporter [Desulfacinum infernum]SHF99603.1 Uncharacterized conserved protein [Desulfacinum infernum DSM 9756]
MRRALGTVLCIVVAVGLAMPAAAWNQNSGLNYGNTNFLDAILPPPGVYLDNYVAYYHSDEFKDADGNKLPLDNELSLLVYVPQLTWIADLGLPRGMIFGVTGLLPVVNANLDSDLGMVASNDNLGDLMLGVFVASHAGKPFANLGNGFDLYLAAEVDVYMPTGQYDKKFTINPGNNFFTIEPFVKFTVTMPHGFSFSMRHHLAFNTENDEYLGDDGQTHDLKPGIMYHFNYCFAKTLDFISPNLRLGAMGYYGKQLTDDELDGRDMKDSKEQIFGIGPGIQYVGKGWVLSLKTYFESAAENKAEGERVVLRLSLPF